MDLHRSLPQQECLLYATSCARPPTSPGQGAYVRRKASSVHTSSQRRLSQLPSPTESGHLSLLASLARERSCVGGGPPSHS